MIALRVNVAGENLCGSCPYSVQTSGICHTNPCANTDKIKEVTDTIVERITYNIVINRFFFYFS